MTAVYGGPRPTIVFDIGGTWFRSGVVIEGELRHTARQPADNYLAHPHVNGVELQDMLVTYLVGETARLRKFLPASSPPVAAISMGAALNGHTGFVYNSGPLWGAASRELDLPTRLRAEAPDITWHVVNDVTAVAAYHASRLSREKLSKLSVITVSTGIAARTYDFATGSIPVGRDTGLQGEIGHLPIDFLFDDQLLELKCDCGGDNHLNAFASGRGIVNVITELRTRGALATGKWPTVNEPMASAAAFFSAVQTGDPQASKVLEAVARPMASVIREMLTLDPQIERVILVGGVVDALHRHYMAALLLHLERAEFYQVTNRNPDYFRQRLSIGPVGDAAGLLGAAIATTRSQVRNQGSVAATDDGSDRVRWRVNAQLPTRYDVIIADGLFDAESPWDWGIDLRASELLFIDAAVERLHGNRVRSLVGALGSQPTVVVLGLQEPTKTLGAVKGIVDALERASVGRQSAPVIAIGGGAVLDAIGVACALYRKGVAYVRVPTTLLAQVDAGIGSKVAVNYGDAKNRLGSYFPPVATLVDPTFLRTLPRRQVASGCAEILKLAVIKDLDLLELLEHEAHSTFLMGLRGGPSSTSLVARAIESMLEELAPNLWEHELARLADFGHTFSPSIEMAAMPSLLHGEAVAIDIALSCVLSMQRNRLSTSELEKVLALTGRLDLPHTHPAVTEELLTKALRDATLHRGGRQRLPLPTTLGSGTFVDDVTAAELSSAIKFLRA